MLSVLYIRTLLIYFPSNIVHKTMQGKVLSVVHCQLFLKDIMGEQSSKLFDPQAFYIKF
jgi:hypothetical protein